MNLEQFSLRGKVAVVTGGARTLGLDMADAFAEAGADLIITSRKVANARITAKELSQRRGVDVLPLELDVTEYDQIVSVAEEAKSFKGRIDILVNNAGGGGGGAKGSSTDFLDRHPDDMESLIRVNIIGALFCCQVFGKFMVGQRSGKIINIASIAGMLGRDRGMYSRSGLAQQPVEYAAAKAGVIGMTRDLAAYLAPYGICVNAISPGGFERGQPPEFIRLYSERTAMGRMGRDGIDLRGAALFLASPASDYVTGHNLVVDGGFSIWH